MSDCDDVGNGLPGPERPVRLAHEAIAAAFEQIGGVDRLVAWIGEDPQNERIFLDRIYPKLLPLQAKAEPEPGKRQPRALTWLPPKS